MKKSLVILVVLALTASCAPYEPYNSNYTSSASTLRSENDILIQDAYKLASDFEDWQKREFSFLAELTEEQLKLYSIFVSSISIQKNVNQAEAVLNFRNLQNSLSEEQCNRVSELLIENAKITQRAQNIVSQEQTLQKQWQTGKEIAQHKYQQSQRYLNMMQQFNQQQRMDQSLHGIENAIINLQNR